VDCSAAIESAAYDVATGVVTLYTAAPLAEEFYQVRIAAGTVKDAAGNALMGGAEFRSAAMAVASQPAAVSVDLQAGSDSGVSQTDDITNVTHPTVDVTASDRGRIEVDFDHDGVYDATVTAPAAGTYAVACPAGVTVPEGSRPIQARLTPWVGEAVTAALTITEDNTGATVWPGGAALTFGGAQSCESRRFLR
jgi:hypothetical protein